MAQVKAYQDFLRHESIKLPKLKIKPFSGDPTEWTSFIDSFEAAVDSNDNLANIEKMNYLRNYLIGDAEAVIKGLKLTNSNYEIGLNLLKDRFVDPQIS